MPKALFLNREGSEFFHVAVSIKFIVILEHFLLMCKRKRSQKKSTRAAHAPANSLSLKQCGLVRSALPPVPSPLLGSNSVCAAACEGLFFGISNLNVRKCQKRCHSEERSDEESWRTSLSFKRFFAALRMTGFYIVRVLRAIRESSLQGLIFFQSVLFIRQISFASNA